MGHRAGAFDRVGRRPRAGLAEHDIGAAVETGGVGRRDHQLVMAIVVDVAGRRHGEAELVGAAGRVVQHEAVGAVQRRQIDRNGRAARTGPAVLLAEQDVGLAGRGAAGARAIGGDQHVAEAVAVDVAGARDGEAGLAGAVEHHHAGIGDAQVHRVGQAIAAAEHQIGAAAVAAEFGGADDEVAEAVAVDVADARYRIAAFGARDAVEAAAGRALEVGEVERGADGALHGDGEDVVAGAELDARAVEPQIAGDDVGAAAVEDGVAAGAALQRAVLDIGQQRIVAGAAVERVGTRIATHRVIAGAAEQDVVAAQSPNCVVATET